MPATAMHILVVGATTLGTRAMLTGLATRGWGLRSVETVREAQDLLEAVPFDIVFAAESLPDGRGYELIETVARHSGTLLVGVALSESWLWLPVMERGANVFGKCALKADVVELEVEMLLYAPSPQNAREIASDGRLGTTRPGLKTVVSPRRKTTPAASSEIPMTSSAQSAGHRQGTLALAETEHGCEVSRLHRTRQQASEPLRTRTTRTAAGMRRPARPD